MTFPTIPALSPGDLPLRGYELPPPVSWWPPAPGWWLLLFGALLLLLIAWYVKRHWSAQGWRRAARRELENISAAYAGHGDAHRLARDVSIFLRRVCLTRFPDRPGVQLTERGWLEYLDGAMKQPGSGMQPLFLSRAGEELIAATYNRHAHLDGPALLGISRSWLERLPARRWRRR